MTTNDDTTTGREPSTPGEEFVIPGTSDTACSDDADLRHCVHCGASLSADSEFCDACKVAASGGEAPRDHDTGQSS